MGRKRITNAEASPDLFTSSRYLALLTAPECLQIQGTRKEIRALMRKECPDQPGVYGMVDSTGQLIYVGMSRSLRSRLPSYFSAQADRKKERRIGRRAVFLIWQPAAHELIARLRERELIRQYRPNFNVQGHPTGMKLGYITLIDQPAGAFSLHPRIPRKHAGVWGPVPITKYLRNAVQELNFHFKLRDCPRETPMQYQGEPAAFDIRDAKACIRADLGTCLAPCIAACTRAAYEKSLASARKFLDGDGQATVKKLQSEMQTAVEDRRYEKAALLHSRGQALIRIDQHLRRFHDWTSQASFLYRMTSSLDQREWWLVVVRGTVEEAIPRPRSPVDKQVVCQHLSQLESQFSGALAPTTLTGPDEFESARILFRWFRLFPDEKDQRLSLAKARRLCQSKRQY